MADLAAVSSTEDASESKRFAVYKGAKNTVKGAQSSAGALAAVRKDIADVLNSKNLAFLFGSGCSSARNNEGEELGIPTMQPMATAFLSDRRGRYRVTKADRTHLRRSLGLNLDDQVFRDNLEALMEVLYGYRFALRTSENCVMQKIYPVVEKVINNIRGYILDVCTNGRFNDDSTVLDTYQQFYRRLIQRDRSLARPWIFTLNYDLFSETAMDRLSIPYINGFLGSIERRFNPAAFRYSLAQQLDLASGKWSSVDSLVYLAKLHGSVSWGSHEEGLFQVVEMAPQLLTADRLLIYPTPSKQNATFASPYSDMFREFQTRVARDQSVLISLGYSFGDEHVNNIIFQALTIPTFRLVAFVDPNANAQVKRLLALDDPRIWIIGTEERDADWKGHYFANFVEDFMAAESINDADKAIGNVLMELLNQSGNDKKSDDE